MLHLFKLYFGIASFFFIPLYLIAIKPPSVSELTLEEKIGQLLMVHFHGTEVNEKAERLMQEACIGGVIFYNWANGLESPKQVSELSQGLQEVASQTRLGIPLFLAVDQEGGLVNRLKKGFTIFPGNYALGRTGEWDWGMDCAKYMGEELRAVGVNLNLAPVLDCYTNPLNPVIGIRSFSQNPVEVARWGACYLQGYKDAGILAAIKHFPGHGDVVIDSHESLPTVSKTLEQLEEVELVPFRALASQADVILTAHLFLPRLDPVHCVTFSKSIIEGLLRESLNYQGIVMTDSMAMQGILDHCSSIEEGVLKSIEAGHDIILLGGKQLLDTQCGLEFSLLDVLKIHRFLVSSVREGHLSEERVNMSVERILALKQKQKLYDFVAMDLPLVEASVNTQRHQSLAKEIAHSALQCLKGEHLVPLKLDSKRLVVVCPDCLKDVLEQTEWFSQNKEANLIYFRGLNPDEQSIQRIVKETIQSECTLFLAYATKKNASQQDLFKRVVQNSSFTIGLSVSDPTDAMHLLEADFVLCTFSPTPCAFQAAFNYITDIRK